MDITRDADNVSHYRFFLMPTVATAHSWKVYPPMADYPPSIYLLDLNTFQNLIAIIAPLLFLLLLWYSRLIFNSFNTYLSSSLTSPSYSMASLNESIAFSSKIDDSQPSFTREWSIIGFCLSSLPARPSWLSQKMQEGVRVETGSLGEEGEGEKKRREDTQEGTEKRKNECVLKQASSRFLGTGSRYPNGEQGIIMTERRLIRMKD